MQAIQFGLIFSMGLFRKWDNLEIPLKDSEKSRKLRENEGNSEIPLEHFQTMEYNYLIVFNFAGMAPTFLLNWQTRHPLLIGLQAKAFVVKKFCSAEWITFSINISFMRCVHTYWRTMKDSLRKFFGSWSLGSKEGKQNLGAKQEGRILQKR